MAQVIPPDRSIPNEIEGEVSRLEREAAQSFNIRRFTESRLLYRQMLQVLEHGQTRARRPIHKGSPLHMIGLCFSVTNQHNRALRYFALAYIEDTLNAGFNLEDEADATPAARMLRDFYGIRIEVLRTIKQISNAAKQASQWSRTRHPEELLRRLENRMNIDAGNLAGLLTHNPPQFGRRQPFGFPQSWERRVFVGGNYQTHMPALRRIERRVNSLGYTPILAFDVEIPRELTHHHTLLLLHTCGYAIFEVSSPSGQLMEIERTQDYDNQVLLLYSRRTPRAAPSPLVSSMVQTAGLRMEGYVELADIDRIIEEFLQQGQGEHNP